MDKLRAAATMALEALEELHYSSGTVVAAKMYESATAALREALGYCIDEGCPHKGTTHTCVNPLVEQSEQEPVAYLRMGSDQRFVVTKAAEELVADTFHQLYAAPLAKQDTHATHVVRTKDLTDDEIRKLWSEAELDITWFARAVIKKFKEKQNG